MKRKWLVISLTMGVVVSGTSFTFHSQSKNRSNVEKEMVVYAKDQPSVLEVQHMLQQEHVGWRTAYDVAMQHDWGNVDEVKPINESTLYEALHPYFTDEYIKESFLKQKDQVFIPSDAMAVHFQPPLPQVRMKLERDTPTERVITTIKFGNELFDALEIRYTFHLKDGIWKLHYLENVQKGKVTDLQLTKAEVDIYYGYKYKGFKVSKEHERTIDYIDYYDKNKIKSMKITVYEGQADNGITRFVSSRDGQLLQE